MLLLTQGAPGATGTAAAEPGGDVLVVWRFCRALASVLLFTQGAPGATGTAAAGPGGDEAPAGDEERTAGGWLADRTLANGSGESNWHRVSPSEM